MSGERLVRFVVPDGIDDLERVSGGNVYDRRVRDGLAAAGWGVMTTEVADADAVQAALAAVPAGGTVLVDGLVAAWAPAAIASAAAHSRVVILAHMVTEAFADADPLRVERERRALGNADHVIATSNWTARELVRRGIVPEHGVTVAMPGSADGAVHRESDETPTHAEAGRLLCVGAVVPHKGQDILLDALARLGTLDWTCTIAGSRDTDRAFAVRIAAAAAGLGSRVRMAGVLDEAELAVAYERSGLLVAPSRAESFGMAIADARSRGLPVLAAAVGGIPESVAGGGAILVEPDDAGALADALEQWMTDPALQARLRAEAAAARASTPRWPDTVERIDRVLGVA